MRYSTPSPRRPLPFFPRGGVSAPPRPTLAVGRSRATSWRWRSTDGGQSWTDPGAGGPGVGHEPELPQALFLVETALAAGAGRRPTEPAVEAVAQAVGTRSVQAEVGGQRAGCGGGDAQVVQGHGHLGGPPVRRHVRGVAEVTTEYEILPED